jgi:predicted transcriptional regulator of viral defense system
MSETKNYAQPRGLQLLESALEQFGPIFTISQVETLPAGRQISRSQLRWYMSALTHSGRLESLKRGTYAVKSPSLGEEIHPFAIAAALVQPSVISHWSALAYHSFTTQIPKMVQVSILRQIVTPEMRNGKTYRPRGRSVWQALGVEVELIHIQPRHFFGHQQIWVSSWHQVAITDPERTVLDLVARPEVFGGLPAAIDILEDTLPRINHTTLVKYGLEYKVGAVIKRLGWILEQLGVPKNKLASLQEYPVQNIYRLDPASPVGEMNNDRWSVNENLRREDHA